MFCFTSLHSTPDAQSDVTQPDMRRIVIAEIRQIMYASVLYSAGQLLFK